MDNHIHLIWQMVPDNDPEAVQRDFLKYMAQRIQKNLKKYHPDVLQHFKVNAKDRDYQFWERNTLSVELRTHPVFIQKLEYIHCNPVKAGICNFPEEYKYSSALFYETGIDNWGFLTHYRD
jgi:REP element-mobilizing transposase RayT